MKKLILTIGFAIWVMATNAQQADARIGELLNKSDWFSLEEEYPVLKDSVQSAYLRLLAETMIAHNFNQPGKAMECIGRLLAQHQQEMDIVTITRLVSLAASIDGEMGNCASAADQLKNFTDQLKVAGITDELESLTELYNYYNQMRNLPVPVLSRPETDVEIPITIQKVKLPTSIEKKGWRGTHILIPVRVHGKNYRFIFDTGAGMTYFSERFAKEIGVRVVHDSLLINGGTAGAAYGKMGFLDSLQVGGMTMRNIKVIVAPPNKMDDILQIDAILGIDFMTLAGEFQIYPKKKKLLFPAQPTSLPATGRNLMFSDKLPLLKAFSGSDRLIFIFDTGCTLAAFYYPYYQKYKEQLDARGVKESGIGGGFNLVQEKEALFIPSVSFKIGDTAVEMKDVGVEVIPGTTGTTLDGILGMSLVNLYKKVTVNLTDMFVEVE